MSSKEAPTPVKGVPKKPEQAEEAPEVVKFSPEEEAELLSESNAHKSEANNLFTSARYDAALTKYDEAVAMCPNHLDYEIAVLKSNIAACNLKLEEWKGAIKSATDALDRLTKVEEVLVAEEEEAAEKKREEEEVEMEIISEGAANAAPAPPPEEDRRAEEARRRRGDDILRIRAKALMRRARARSEQGGWANLTGAEEDYKALSKMSNLSPADAKVVRAQLKALPARTKAAQDKEMGEMLGKLKDLGNGILKPFGLSTDNFEMTKDEKTGGYSMNFKQG